MLFDIVLFFSIHGDWSNIRRMPTDKHHSFQIHRIRGAWKWRMGIQWHHWISR
jgi:hypothetical protein